MSETSRSEATVRENEIAAALDAVPGIETWEGLDALERERRIWILDQIRRRIIENGPRHTTDSPDRGRLFMPFAALDGYGGMLAAVENEVARGDDSIRETTQRKLDA